MRIKLISSAALFCAATAFANAASVIPTDLQNDNLIYFWDFSSSGNPTRGTVSGTNFTYNEGGYGTLTGAGPYTTSVSNIKANSFTFSFDVSSIQINQWCDILSIYTNSQTSGDNNALMVQSDGTNTGNIQLYIGGIGGATTYFGGATTSRSTQICEYSKVGGTTWTTITFSSNGSTFSVYVDGKKTGTVSLTTTEEAITGFQVGSAFGDQRVMTSGSFDNIAFWNVALTDAQVLSLVPEPSAFGLLAGLGAIALAVSRRRRRSR